MAYDGVTARDLRQSRIAVAVLFLTNGAIFANLLARYPQLKADLALTNTALGGAIAAFPLGALLAWPAVRSSTASGPPASRWPAP